MLSRRKSRGQVLLLSVVLLSVVLGLVGAFTGYLGGVRKATNTFSARAAARQAALAGIEKALWCLNQSSGTDCGGSYGGTYVGQASVSVGSSGYYTTVVETVTNNLKDISSVGYYPNATNPVATVTIRAEATITTTSASFFYGVQVGNGGFVMGNNAYVDGNIYANGSIIGVNGAYITGDVWVAGGTQLAPDQQQSTNNEDFEFGRTSPIIDLGQSFKLSSGANVNKVSFYIRKNGNPSSATVRILANDGGVPSKTVIGTATLASSSVSSSFGWVEVSFSTPPALSGNVTYWLSIDASSNGSNYYVIGSLPNNGYGNGVGMRSASWNAATPVWTDAGRDYAFSIYTGGLTTKIDNVDINGSAHANTIKDLSVGGDAYYQTITNTNVAGASHPGTSDPGPVDMPLSDAMIDQWKADAAAGGTITGDATYDGTTASLGPKKITGNLTIANGASITVNGTLYVQGDVLIENNAVVSLAAGYGSGSGVIIADGKINISNNVAFNGSGAQSSYVLILTTNTSLDSANPAMSLSNNSDNSVFYASDGVITIANNAVVKEVTGFKIDIANNASVQYESGLSSVNFSSGPGGSWVLRSGSTREIR